MEFDFEDSVWYISNILLIVRDLLSIANSIMKYAIRTQVLLFLGNTTLLSLIKHIQLLTKIICVLETSVARIAKLNHLNAISRTLWTQLIPHLGVEVIYQIQEGIRIQFMLLLAKGVRINVAAQIYKNNH